MDFQSNNKIKSLCYIVMELRVFVFFVLVKHLTDNKTKERKTFVEIDVEV